MEELLKEQRKTNELLETILNTKQNNNLPHKTSCNYLYNEVIFLIKYYFPTLN